MKKSGKIIAFMTAISAVSGIFPAMINNVYAVEGDGYTWVLEPSVQAEDINVVYEKAGFTEANFGYFIESQYSLKKFAGQAYYYYSPIDYNGDTVNTIYGSQYISEENNHIEFWNHEEDYVGSPTPATIPEFFCTKAGEIVNSTDVNNIVCTLCDSECRGTSVDGWYAYYDEENKLLYGCVPNPFEVLQYDNKFEFGSEASRGKVEGDYFNTVGSATINESTQEITLNRSFGILKNGEMLVGFDEGYDNALTYKDGVTALRRDGKWYYFDEDGNQMADIPACNGALAMEGTYNETAGALTYENTVPYLPSENYIAVNTDNGGGYYDTDGNNIIPIGEFEAVRPVYDGKAWVKSDGLWGVIDLTGSISIPTETTTTAITTTTTTSAPMPTTILTVATATAIGTGVINTTTATRAYPAGTTTAINPSGNSNTTTALSGNTENSGTTVSGSTQPENNSNNNSSNSNSNSNSSSSSTGKSSPKTSDAGVGIAVTGIAIAAGMAFVARKKKD